MVNSPHVEPLLVVQIVHAFVARSRQAYFQVKKVKQKMPHVQTTFGRSRYDGHSDNYSYNCNYSYNYHCTTLQLQLHLPLQLQLRYNTLRYATQITLHCTRLDMTRLDYMILYIYNYCTATTTTTTTAKLFYIIHYTTTTTAITSKGTTPTTFRSISGFVSYL